MKFPDKVRVKITQYDIDHGTRRDPFNCPEALAAHRTFKELLGKDFHVGVSHYVHLQPLGWTLDSRMEFYKGTKKWDQFRTDFDNYAPVKPATYTLTRRRLTREVPKL